MPNYNLAVVDEPGRVLSTPAKDRPEALAIFGKELGKQLTQDKQEGGCPYMLDEWEQGPHWVNPTIPVYEIPG